MGFPSIEERLSRVERQNRMLRLMVLALIVLAGVGLLSSVRAVRAQAPKWQRTVEAQEFVLRDSSGKMRAELGVATTGPFLRLYDDDGNPRAILESDGVTFFDASGQTRASLDISAGNPSLTLRDSGGFKSVFGHVVLQTPATGEQSLSSAASIHLFNKEGYVFWSVP